MFHNLIAMKYIIKIIGQFYKSCVDEFKAIFHDKGVMIFIFLLPLIYPVVYALIYNPELSRDVKAVVVDDDRSEKSRAFVRKIDASEGVRIIGYAANMEEAKDALAEKQCYGIIRIDRNFENDIVRGERGKAMLYCDMSLLIRYKALLSGVTEASFDLGSEIQFETIGALGASGPKLPPVYKPAYYPLGNPEQGFATFLLPGIMILVIQQTILLAICMLAGGRFEKFRAGLIASPGITGDFLPALLGKAGTFVIIYIPIIFYLLFILPYAFQYPQEAGFWDLLILCVPFILSVVFFGMTLQVLVRERESVFVVIVFSSVLMLFASGITWPLFSTPAPLQFVGGCIPSTWAMQAFERMNANGASLYEVGFEMKMLWILTFIYGITAYIANRFTSRNYKNAFLDAEN